MNQNVLNGVYQGACRFVKDNSPTILSIFAVVGVIGTSVSVGKATIKASNKLSDATKEKGEDLTNLEMLAIITPVYIPSILIGGGTIACILGANILNQRAQATLASAYGLVDQSFKEYRKKLIELHGEEMDQEIRTEIARAHCDYHVIGLDYPDQKVSWYEPYSNRYFEMYEREIIDAEYHLNRNFILAGSQSLNNWYNILGLEPIKKGDDIGWRVCDGYLWIDFEHALQHKPDGTEYYILQPLFAPMTEEEMEECGYSL